MILQADAEHLPFEDKSIDLVLGSPPYLDARTYGDAQLHQRNLDEWIQWMLSVTTEAVRVSRGLVLWVCAGVTRDYCYQPGPEGLLYEWVRRGGIAWRPAYWRRVGIPGSGGKQWLRADVEYVLAFTGDRGLIPFADNTANGHPPKWAPGGEMSYRNSKGTRRNQWGAKTGEHSDRNADGEIVRRARPSHRDAFGFTPGCEVSQSRRANGERRKTKQQTRRKANGERPGKKTLPSGERRMAGEEQAYVEPVLANPGNLVNIKVGGGMMGSRLAHLNEAPYPEDLAKWFIRSHCPPGGICLDPFSGSATTVAAAIALGRKGIGCDIRFSQCEIGTQRLACGTQTEMFH